MTNKSPRIKCFLVAWNYRWDGRLEEQGLGNRGRGNTVWSRSWRIRVRREGLGGG